MSIFVYTDESGTFDRVHNDIYVYGGVLFLCKNDKDNFTRMYLNAEKIVRDRKKHHNLELKGNNLNYVDKGKLFRSINQQIKFATVINQKNVLESIFHDKKSKQRYLDYAYKIGLKKCLSDLISQGLISPDYSDDICIYVDEHTTATNGRYELREGIESELVRGTFNYKYTSYYPPILPKVKGVQVSFCNSEHTTLIRAADIVANKVYYHAMNNRLNEIKDKVFITMLPWILWTMII